MKKLLIILTFIFIFIFAGGAAVFALTRPPEIEIPRAYLSETKGSVFIQKAKELNWQTAVKNFELEEGDIIKTGEESEAEVIFYDLSASRIGPNSEVLLENLTIDAENIYKQEIGLFLMAGRIWSRIIRLLDKDAEFQVKTSSTVATVRGTALDVWLGENEETTVAVDESAVEVKVVETEKIVDPLTQKVKFIIIKELVKTDVPAGKMVSLKKEFMPKIREEFIAEEIKEEFKNSQWFKINQEKDESFLNFVEEKEFLMIEKKAGILPGSPFYSLKRAAEGIRLNFLPSERKIEMALNFAERRLREAQMLAKEGQPELAEQLMRDFDRGVRERIEAAEHLTPEQKDKIFEKLNRRLEVEEKRIKILDREERKEFKEKFLETKENILQQLKNLQGSLGETGFLSQVAIMTERYLEFQRLIGSGRIEEAKKIITQLQAQASILQEASERWQNNPQAQNLIVKIMQIKDLENPENLLFQYPDSPPLGTQDKPAPPAEGTSPPSDFGQLNDSSSSSSSGSLTDESVSTAEPLSSRPTIKGLFIKTPRENLAAGESLLLSCILQLSDGTVKDISPICQWSLSGDPVGKIQAGFLETFEPGGTIEVSAKFVSSDGQVFSASKKITVLIFDSNPPAESSW